ncbi:MAG: hypothetical protein M1835_005083 [Candelina submexicana]|nr:MAG: hypothetical protein M1835_005083 [Candelina submexicana]
MKTIDVMKTEDSNLDDSHVDAGEQAEVDNSHSDIDIADPNATVELSPEDTTEDHPEPEQDVATAENDYEEDTSWQCPFCFDNLKNAEHIEVECGHVLCRGCTNTFFEHAINNESQFPPKCCDCTIPLETAAPFLDASLIQRYHSKDLEYSTTNRLYCAEPNCLAFIGPNLIGRKDLVGQETLALCSQCETVTCGACRTVRHEGECELDAQTEEVLQLGETEGWQRCFRCRHLIAISYGCNHMICSCGAEFCYLCAAPWKRCGCPTTNEGLDYDYDYNYNYDYEEDDDDDDEANYDYPPRQMMYTEEELQERQRQAEQAQHPTDEQLETTQIISIIWDEPTEVNEVEAAWIQFKKLNFPDPEPEPPEPVVHVPRPFTEQQKTCTHSFRPWWSRVTCQRCAWHTDLFIITCRNCEVDVCSNCSLRLEWDNSDWRNPDLPEADATNATVEGSNESVL